MNSSTKVLIATVVTFILYIAFSLPVLIRHYQPENYVVINGTKYTEVDVQKSDYEGYKPFQKQYTEGLKQVFMGFAEYETLRLEAKSQGITVEELLKKGSGNYSPSEEEIMSIYEINKPRLGGRGLEEVRDMIVRYLGEQKKAEFRDKIKEKYTVLVVTKEPERMKVEIKNNPSTGPENAKITVIEFSDFECPYCQKGQDTNRKIREKYKDQIRWVFRDYPLPFHENAMFAHIAANCANQQGKYWEMFDLLFQNTGNLPKPTVLNLAKSISGLDQSKFEECAADKDGNLVKEIEADIADGQKVGVNGTPAFFVNGILLEGLQDYARFEAVIEKELK
jgi:protein-disulfide isomerase